MIYSPDPKAASPKVNLVSSAFGPLVVAGSNITLSCTTVAYPHPTSLTFYHNGEAISETTDGVDLHQWKSGNATTLYGQLVINNSSVSHSGTYTCTAVNYVEEVSEQTEMFVYGKLSFCTLSIIKCCRQIVVEVVRIIYSDKH